MHDSIKVATAEQWLRNAKESWGMEIDEEDWLPLLFALKPEDTAELRKAGRKPRPVQKKSSSSERALMAYDESKCDARAWNDGFGAQCHHKKLDGQCFCKTHQTEAGKHEGALKNGLFNEERPTHHYGDESQKMIPWDGVVIEKKAKGSGKKSSGERHCGSCGETGHNKRNCPMKEELASVSDEDLASMPMSKLKKHARAVGVSSAKLDTADDADDVRAAVIDLIHGTASKKAEKAEKAEEAEKKKKFDTARKELKKAVEGMVEETVEETVEENLLPDPVDEEEDLVLDEDTSHDGGLSPKWPTLSTDDGAGTGLSPCPSQTESEEDSSTTEVIFEKIPYTRDDENKVFDNEFDEVGEWNGTTIEFTCMGKKIHRLAKMAL